MVPGSRAPGIVQLLDYGRDPLGFLSRQQRRFGDIFAIHFPYFGRIVYVAEPGLVKELFTADPAVFHAGEANATVLEPALGPNSVLTLDDGPHLRQRKLLLPPFHGERVERYGELILEITRGEMESWPVGEPFALRPHTQRITLAVIMRAVFGVHDEGRLTRFEGLIDEFARRVGLVASIPPLRRDLGRLSPWGRFVRSRRALDAFIYEEIALRRAEAETEERDDVLSLLLGARDEEGEPMSDRELRDEMVTVLGAGHETTATGLAWAIERLTHNPAVLAKLRDSLAEGEEDYLAATVRETLRARPVIVDVGRKLTAPATIGGHRLPAGSFVLAGDRRPPLPRGHLPRARGLPPRALPRRQARQLRLDPLRRRHPPLHRRRLRRIRDADDPARVRRARRPAPGRPEAGKGQDPQHHAGPGQGCTSGAGSRPGSPDQADQGRRERSVLRT